MYGDVMAAGLDAMRFRQDHRLIRVKSALEPEPFVVKRFQGEERVSAPFAFEVDLLSADMRLELKQAVGQPMRLSLATDRGDRHFHGYVREFARIGSDGDMATYRAEIAPWFAFLDYTENCRIFQDRAVPEIVEEVFAQYGELADYRLELNPDQYPRLPYCVQYNESDFAFVSRLLEDAGIYYAFEHREDGHVLVLADDSTRAKPIGEAAAMKFKQGEGVQADEGLDTWAARRRIQADVHALKSFDFKQPRSALAADRALAIPRGRLPALERYHYDGAARFADSRIGEALANLRSEEAAWQTKLFEGAGPSRKLHAGGYFVLEGHYDHHERDESERQFFVVRVRHEGGNNFTSDFSGAEPASYRCSIACLRRKIPFRPLRATLQPRMPGPQTATVVGPPGEELYADRYGRVKVQFHWDRQGHFDERSSCWVRVASSWAGSGMGGVSPPRVGQEVVVDFLDGNPDRPIVVARVFNEDNMPPFGLEVSGLRSKTVQGEGYNEVTMHDAAGSELLNLRAQRDMATTVLNDQNATVNNNKSTSVANNHTLSVGADQSISVGANRGITVAGNDSLGVTGNCNTTITGTAETQVTGAVTETYQAGETKTIAAAGYNETITGDYNSTLTGNFVSRRTGTWEETVTGTSSRHVQGAVTETLGSGREVQVTGADRRTVQGAVEDANVGARTVSVEGDMEQGVAGSFAASSGGEMSLVSGSRFIAAVGGAGIEIRDGEITITAGGSQIVINGGGVSVNGTEIKLN